MTALLCVIALGAGACGNKKDKASVAALEGLREAISHNTDTERFGDSRAIAENAIFLRAEGVESSIGMPLSQGALDVMLGDIRTSTEPRNYWARARVYFARPGACVKIEDVELPRTARTAEPNRGWQQSVKDKHAAVTQRLTDAYAADFRCGDGPRFTAVFVRAVPLDGTYRVADITASSRGR